MMQRNSAMIAEETEISSLSQPFEKSAMKKRPPNCSVLVSALCFGTMINSTTAGSFARECATRDLQILMLIEESESTNAILQKDLSDALLTNARMVCHEGHVVDALAIYDGIARSLAPGVNRSKLPYLAISSP